MASERRNKLRGTTVELDQTVGSQGLLAVDYEKNRLRLYDGILLGGRSFLNADDIAAAYTLPTRLGEEAIKITGASHSANEAVANGYYSLTPNVTDQPAGTSANATLFVSQTEDNERTQLHTQVSDGRSFTRTRKSDGAWTAWQRLVTDSYLTTNAAAVAYDSARLGGQLPAYYANVVARLGYTPINKAGDSGIGSLSITGNLTASGSLAVNGGIDSNSLLSGAELAIDGNAGVGGALAVAGQITTTSNLLATGTVGAGGNGAARLKADGDINGSIWGGTAGYGGTSLSQWLAANKLSRSGGDWTTGDFEVRKANAQIRLSLADGSLPYDIKYTTPHLTVYRNGIGVFQIRDDGDVYFFKNANLLSTLLNAKAALTDVLGIGQTYVDVTASRVSGTAVTNSTSKPIVAYIAQSGSGNTVQVASNGVDFLIVGRGAGNSGEINITTVIVPVGAAVKAFNFSAWVELR